MVSLDQITSAWNTFFYDEISCSALVMFRIATGFLLLLNVILLLPLTEEYYSADGLWPTNDWQRTMRSRRFSLLSLLPPTTNSFRLLLLIHFVASASFLVGFQFRLSCVVTFLTLVSIHHRNVYILSSGDSLLRLMLFYACFSHAGDGLSVDRWLAGYDAFDFGKSAAWPLRLMQIQVSVVYLRTVHWKLKGKTWWNGTAAWYPLWAEVYVRFRPPKWMLNRVTIAIATWGTLVTEVAFGTLVWIEEFRYPMIVLGILFHLKLDIIMNLQLFSWVMICSWLVFVPPPDLDLLFTSFR